MQPDLSGTVLLERYRLLDTVGHGRFGSVYLARDLRTNAVRAVKVLHREIATENKFLQRFQREAQILRRLMSPFIIRVFDYGEQRGLNFIVMELVQGNTLGQVIEERERLPVKQAVEIARQIATALASTHRAGIIHRDLKPANIILGNDGVIKLADFGIARAIDSVNVTGSGFVGTAFYAAPEQANSQQVDIRSDIYALGVVMYEMLTGRLVFEGDAPLSVALKHVYEPVPSLRRYAPDVPDPVAEIVYRCLEKKPEARYQTPDEMLRAISAVQSGSSRGEAADALVAFHEKAQMLHERGDFDEMLALCDKAEKSFGSLPEIGEYRRQARAGLQSVDGGVIHVPAGAWLETVQGIRLPMPTEALVVTIGRKAPLSQVFPDLDLGEFEGKESVSRRHARFIRQGNHWFLQEDQSRHGTYVNESSLDAGTLIRLNEGDQLRFGAVRLIFHCQSSSLGREPVRSAGTI